YGDLTWKKLANNLKEREGNLQELDAYRTSKIALKRQAEGKKTGVDTAEAKADVERLGPKYEKTATRIREFQKATIAHYGKDLLGAEGVAAFNKEYYSSLYRVMDSGKDSILAPGSLAPKKPWYKLVGSERRIIPPSESDPYNAAMLIQNARKNDAVLAYAEKIQKGELPGRIRKGEAEKIPQALMEQLGLDDDLEELASTLYAQTRK